METQEVIETLEKELGIKLTNWKGVSYWNNRTTSVRVIDLVNKYAYAEIKGIVDKTYWITNLEQATNETVDEFISKVKLHLPEVENTKEENIYAMIDEIKDYQRKINLLLNEIEKEMK